MTLTQTVGTGLLVLTAIVVLWEGKKRLAVWLDRAADEIQ